MNWENKEFEGIYYSRFIASWTNTRGRCTRLFREWLKYITVNGKHLPEDVIYDIYDMGTNGKLELEMTAESFTKDMVSDEYKKMIEEFKKDNKNED